MKHTSSDKNDDQTQSLDEDEKNFFKLRPKNFCEFIGQDSTKDNLRVFIESAKKRSESLDHVLIHGPPGLGKTTMAQIIANELNVGYRATSGPVITKSGDLAAILTNLSNGDVLFIDEIHRLNPLIEETLYPAMEDFQLDLVIGEGPSARSVRIDLPKFTLVGATTRAGLLTTPLRDRFGIQMRVDFYESHDLVKIIDIQSKKLKMILSKDGALEIAKRSRGTPRIAGRLLKRVRDLAYMNKDKVINSQIADEALSKLNIDKFGLDKIDRTYLLSIAKNYDGGPVGIDTLAAIMSEQKDLIEEVIEPYLLQIGFLIRTSRGRCLTKLGWEYLNLSPSNDKVEQLNFLE